METKQSANWAVFLVLGMMLNTLGIALPGIGWFRYVLMAAGLALLLAAVLVAQRGAGARGGRGSRKA